MKFQYKVLAIFTFGIILGRMIRLKSVAVDWGIQVLLVILLVLIGIEGGYSVTFRGVLSGLKKSFATLTASILGSFLAGIAFFPFMGKISIAASLGLGWYTFTGSYLTAQLGALSGLVGFLTNLSREVFGMLAIPSISKRVSCEAIISLAGSPASDTLFPFIYRECGDEYIIPSISQGLLTAFAVPALIFLVAGT